MSVMEELSDCWPTPRNDGSVALQFEIGRLASKALMVVTNTVGLAGLST
jgi:hypothetical protein